jgi:tripartite-type tricarboxylate transporter receptor subunit TctC
MLPQSGFAAAWPKEKIIRAIVPFAAGSTIDIIGRIVLDPLSSALGQTIVVENRGGAGGTIGSAAVAKSDPDGYTLLINASAHSAAPAVYPNLAYDPAKDFAGVAIFGIVPNVLLVAPASGIRRSRPLSSTPKPARSHSPRPASAAPRTGRLSAFCSRQASERLIFRSAADRRRSRKS